MTISRDKEVLVVIGAGGEILVEAEDSARRELFAKLQYALMTVADLDGAWRSASDFVADDPSEPDVPLPAPVIAEEASGTVISLAARRSAKEPGAGR
ncbi:MAG: hypothetical protein AAF441_17675 [Pseudomonadota bacterium]